MWAGERRSLPSERRVMMAIMVESTGQALGRRLREKDLSAAPKAVSLLEDKNRLKEAKLLMKEVSPEKLGGEAPGHIVGITGPPGVGKSSLIRSEEHRV